MESLGFCGFGPSVNDGGLGHKSSFPVNGSAVIPHMIAAKMLAGQGHAAAFAGARETVFGHRVAPLALGDIKARVRSLEEVAGGERFARFHTGHTHTHGHCEMA